ncbi:peptidoglycan recognition protein 1-like [Ambystoma mexicanum]|uniref:peptidoglycan recognition protein 1-like n=1 Tax=Ambystoma mexicanum TaxID=8296 RepID=UPI0037E7B917
MIQGAVLLSLPLLWALGAVASPGIISSGDTEGAAGCPTIVTRSQWGARRVNCLRTMATPVPFVIIHHTEGAACTTRSACISQVRGIQRFHIDSRRWCDIGYSFLVGEDGNVYEGRGWNRVGAHAPSMNGRSIGVSVIGSFSGRNPSVAAQRAVQSLIRCGVSRVLVRSNYVLKGHRNVSPTSCPGNSFYNLIRTWPRFRA